MSLLRQARKTPKKKLPPPPAGKPVSYDNVLIVLTLILVGALVVLGFSIYTRNQAWAALIPTATATLTGTPIPILPTAQPIAPTAPPAAAPSSRRPKNCDDAKAMGLSASQAGAWSHLDRDGDGVACYGD